MATRTGNALSAFLAMAFVLAGIGAQAESHVRIIRLSYIDGTVQMDRATGQGLERAILNTPVTEGVRLATGNDGLAEVEFENNSTLRLGEDSEVQFTKLLINDSGAKVNEIQLVKGTAYFDTKGSKDDIYRATVGDSTFLIHRDTEARLSTDSGSPTLAVLKGEAELQNPSHEVKVAKRETLTVDSKNAAGYDIAKGVDAEPLDRWNDERSAYQTAYSYNNSGVSSGLNGYGYSDLNYYGGWSNIPGVGYGWQPYGVSNWMGWNPYLAGAWAFYPNMGYAWASAYPWGWLPYHYGSWSYLGGSGWFWLPGSGNTYRNTGWYANGFQAVPVVNGPPGFVAPTRPLVTGGATTYAPTMKVGTIGNMPPTIPGGRAVPNFRSVIPTTMPSRTADRALTVPNRGATPYVPPTANKGASPVVAGAGTPAIYGQHSGHVFAAPPHATASGAGGWSGYGGGLGSGSTASSPSSIGAVSGSHGASGASHASGGHGSPK